MGRNCTSKRKTCIQETIIELEIVALTSGVDKNTKVYWESLEKQALGCSLIFCVCFAFNILFEGKHKFCELTFFFFLKDTLLKVVPM